jgi:hypothetical protein
LGSAVAGAFVHGPLISGILDLASLSILGPVFEAPLRSVLVDFGDSLLLLCEHQVDLRLLAAHQRSNHIINDALLHK